MKRLLSFGILIVGLACSPASASTITFIAPPSANGLFDVIVQADNLFAGRDPLTDAVISYGFNVSVSDPSTAVFLNATSGPLFDPATSQPGTDVFGAASGFGVIPPFSGPLVLAILHFNGFGAGTAQINISSNLGNPFQGLQFLNAPFQVPIDGTISVAAVPEPATLGLVAFGLAGLVPAVRRRRRTKATAAREP